MEIKKLSEEEIKLVRDQIEDAESSEGGAIMYFSAGILQQVFPDKDRLQMIPEYYVLRGKSVDHMIEGYEKWLEKRKTSMPQK